MNYQALAREFWANGYLVVEDFFSSVIMDDLNERSLHHFGMQPDWEHSDEFIQKSATEVIPWFPKRAGDHSFDVIESDQRLASLTEAILGPGWDALYTMVMFSKHGTKGQAWHQDCPPENPDQFNLNRLVYTHDINASTGGQTIVQPKTHRSGPISVGDPHEDLVDQVVLSPKKGTLVILHGHNWHRVLPVLGTYRLSVNCRAIPTQTPENITDIAVYRNMRYRFSTHEIIEERV
ncbi:MAG: phytanoyl-CoA dioxygenase family protein [Bacteroidota bacterium]